MSAPAVPLPPPATASPGTGRFSALLEEDLWSWSEDLVALLGHAEPPTLVTTDLFLHHVVPADRPATLALLRAATGHPGTVRVRARTSRGRGLGLVITAGPRPRAPGSPGGLSAGIEGGVAVCTEPGDASSGPGPTRLITHARQVVASAFGLGTEAALALLGHHARARRLTVDEVAEDVLRACGHLPTHQVPRGLVAAALSGEPAAMRVQVPGVTGT